MGISTLGWILSIVIGFWLGSRISSYKEMGVVFNFITLFATPSCLLLSLGTSRHPWLCPLLTVGAIAIGVGADAMTDTKIDRNLWGIEAILAAALAVPGATAGGLAGVFLSRKLWNTKREPNQAL